MATPAVIRVVEREARVFRALWRGLMFSMFLNPALFLVAMGLGLGGLIDQNSGTVEGLDYLVFVAPGLMVASAMQLTAGESFYPVVAGVKWMRFYFGVVAAPIGTNDLYGGFLVWTALRTMLVSSAFLIVAAVLGGVPSAWGILAVPATALCCLAFAAPIAAFAVTQEGDVAFPVIMRLGIMPLFLFSGTFFPVSDLPDWLEPLARLSPLWHGVELARMATTGDLEAGPALVSVLYLGGWIAVGSWFALRNYARRLEA